MQDDAVKTLVTLYENSQNKSATHFNKKNCQLIRCSLIRQGETENVMTETKQNVGSNIQTETKTNRPD